jgi:hypothetical protein
MARDGHEQCSKHREEAGASSSSRDPTVQPKKLAKRPRPSTLREESSLEDSLSRGGTPDSPDEFECLKIKALVDHMNWEVVNYNKEDPRNIVTLREKACYN